MKKFPNALVLVLYAIFLAWILSFILPKGSYKRQVDEATQSSRVVPGSYTVQDMEDLGLFDLFLAVPKGIAGRADLIVLILILGGCFYIIEKSGALEQGLHKLLNVLQGKEVVALIVLSVLFMAGGVAIALQEEIIAMTPILVLFGRTLGYDAKIIVLATLGSAILGAAFSPLNPFGVVIAQQEAGVELLSGYSFRLVVLFIVLVFWLSYLFYAVSKNSISKKEEKLEAKHLSIRNTGILVLFAATFIVVTYGLIALEWGFNEMSACFFVLGIASGLLANFGLNGTVEVYIAGFKEMIFAAMICGFANGITVLMQEGLIIDTIVHGLFTPLEKVNASFSAVLMLFSQALLHLPVPSTSGQAILTMPILAPLSDLIGLSRQVCVLAYQYGAILMDLVVPTNGAVMAVISLAGIPYNQWFKFILRPLFLLFVLAIIAILVAIQLGI